MKEIIRLSNVSLEKYGKMILDGIELSLSPGSCCTVVGPNGAGKSSLLSVLSGYDWPSTGAVSFCGETYGDVDLFSVRKHIGVVSNSRVPEFPGFFTVRQIIETGFFGCHMIPFGERISPQQSAAISAMLEKYELVPFGVRRYNSLSTGEKMKTLILRAIVNEPRLLLLDEPAAGLDIYNRAVVMSFIETLDLAEKAMLIISHHLEEVPSRSDNIMLLKDGRIFKQGLPDETFTNDNMSALFGCNVKVMKIDSRFYTRAELK
ncbi:MAG: ABC transporter ATP-binding protein [Phycisphaerae bacterium]|jgi:iron complex transport system ATP-binding protein